MENKIRVILDTNLWISYLISKRLKKIDELCEQESIVLIFSQELLEEFIEVVSRPKFTRYFSKQGSSKVLVERLKILKRLALHNGNINLRKPIKYTFTMCN